MIEAAKLYTGMTHFESSFICFFLNNLHYMSNNLCDLLTENGNVGLFVDGQS